VEQRFDSEKELTCFRVIQESLTNIIKHSGAREVYVNLIKKDNAISLSVEDNGEGFVQDKISKVTNGKNQLGLLIMRERANQLGGEFTIESFVGKGTHVLMEIPL